MSRAEHLPDQAARDAAATRLDVNAFIEAGAGTGKSTTLVSRILNELTGPQRLPITSIAAITFTDRAGTELRHRLREAITTNLAEEDRAPDDLEALQDALQNLDAAAIGTIHSFAQRILRTHALSRHLPIGFTTATGTQAAEDMRDRVREAVEHLQTSLDPATLTTLASYGKSPYGLYDTLTALDGNWLRLDDDAFTAASIDLGALCAPVADEFENFLTRAREDCEDEGDKLMAALEERIPPVVDLLRRADEAELASAAASAVDGHPVFKLGNAGGKKAWGPEGAKARRDELKELSPALTECLLAPLEAAVRTALAAARPVMRAHRDRRARTGLVTFDELLSRARDLLRDDDEVRAQVHMAFPLILVDEFQDTDPIQWQLIRLITADPHDPDTRPEPGHLVVVGDPKQAIYGFRGANIDTYLSALTEFTSRTDPWGEVFKLTTNFRSVGPLIDWINPVFSAAMHGQPDQVPYAPLRVFHRPAASDPGPAVVVLRDPEPPTSHDDAATPSPEISTVLEPRLVAQEITRAINGGWQVTEPGTDKTRHYTRSATFGDIAVLYPARTGMPALLEALDEAGVPYRSSDAKLVFQRPVVLGLLAALAVIDDPSRQLDLWLALKSPLFGCTDIDLLEFRTAGGRWQLAEQITAPDAQRIPGPVSDALELLHATRQHLPLPQPAGVIDHLLGRTRIMEALAGFPRGAFEADCVRMVRAHAQQFQDDGGVGLTDYLALANDVQTDTTQASLPDPDIRDDNAVRLMTIHQAKGLEFPIVVLAGMAHNIYDPDPDIGVVSEDRYEFNLHKGLRSMRYEDWTENQRRPRSLAEQTRLLYVACTRARDHLIVSICGKTLATKPKDDSKERKKVPHASLLWDAIPPTSEDVTSLDDPPITAEAPGTTTVPPLPNDWTDTVERIQQASRRPFVVTASGTAAEVLGLHGIAPDPGPGEPPEELVAVAEGSVAADTRATRDGRPLGRAVHAALDQAMRMGTGASAADIEQACATAARMEDIPTQVDDVYAYVSRALESDLLRQALASPRKWTELYLAAPVNTDGVQLVEGFADLVFEGPDGLILVDYKTDETIDEATQRHYAAQLTAYAEMIRRAAGSVIAAQHLLHITPDAALVLDH